MLLIDGVRYNLWVPKEEKQLEEMVKEHYKEIFGKDSIYFDLKQKLTSKSGVVSIPDGYVISLSKPFEWYIVEGELSTHPLHEHITNQLNKFMIGIRNPNTQRELVDAFYLEIENNKQLRAYIEDMIGSPEITRFLYGLISNVPKIVVVIEEKGGEVQEACDGLKVEPIVVEFKTYVREDAENVHIHSFEPSYSIKIEQIKIEEKGRERPLPERYTEAFHIEGVEKEIISTYEHIRNAMIHKDSEIKINPQKYYISLRKNRNFAYMYLRKKKMNIVIMLPFKTGDNLIRKHRVKQLSEGIQKFYNGPCFEVSLETEDNLDEIMRALEEAYTQQK